MQRPATCLLGCELDTSNLQRPPGPASMLTFLHSLPLLRAAFRALYRKLADLKAQVCLRINPRVAWKRDQTQLSETRHTRDPRTVVTVGNSQARLSPASQETCTKGALTLYFIAAVVWSDEPWSYPSHSVKHCSARPSIEHRAGWKGEPSPPALMEPLSSLLDQDLQITAHHLHYFAAIGWCGGRYCLHPAHL